MNTEIIKMQLNSLHEYRLKTLELKISLKNTSWKNYKREMQKINDRLFMIDQNEANIMQAIGIKFNLIHEKANGNDD